MTAKCKKKNKSSTLHTASEQSRRPAQRDQRKVPARIGTWNVHHASSKEKLAEIALWCKELGIMALAIQEHKRTMKIFEDWEFEGEQLKGWRFVGTKLTDKKEVKGLF